MSLMANPMEALQKYQQALNTGAIDRPTSNLSYLKFSGEVNGGKKLDYVKIVGDEVQAIAIFGEEERHKGVDRYSVGYAVSESQRGRGLAVEAVNIGIEDLKNELSRNNKRSFFVEALIDVKNSPSIRVAKKLFPGDGVQTSDSETDTPALLFYKKIVLG